MAVSQPFIDMLRDLLTPVGPLTIKHMFGGASLYADGVLFALVDDDVLYFKSDAAGAAKFTAEGLQPFTYEGKTRPVSMAYWRAPDRLYDDPDEMLEWARDAVRAGRAAALNKKPKDLARNAPKSTARKSKRP